MNKDIHVQRKTNISVPDLNATEVKIALPFLRHISIGNKLKFGFASLFTIIFITSMLSIFGLEYVRGHFEYAVDRGYALESLSLDAQTQLLKARSNEKDFLLRWRKLGVITAKQQYLSSHGDAIALVRQNFKKIEAVFPHDEPSSGAILRQSMGQLNEQLSVYEQDLNIMVGLIEEVGFDDYGLVGHFRRDADNVEQTLTEHGLESAEINLLQLRRYEKDYLLRGHKKYIKKVSDSLLMLKQGVNKSVLPANDKLATLALLDDYWASFEKLTTDLEKLTLVEQEFNLLGNDIELATEKFRRLGKTQAAIHLLEAEQGTDNTELLVSITVVTLLILGFMLAYLLASHIRTPLHLLDSTVMKIRGGDFGASVPIITSDETGRLAIAFNEMNNKLNTAMADIKQNVVEIEAQRQLSEKLLLNILPKEIASRLKEEQTIAQWHGQVTVLFADMVGFTKLSALLTATELVSRLNKIFTAFDEIAQKHQLEKIKTMGDCYMAAGGLPEAREDHAEIVADLALELVPVLDEINRHWQEKVNIRIGINTGPVVAGVIGKSKFIYDLWGDAVNTASRMESHGVVGKIQVSQSTYQLLQAKYDFEARGEINVKGKGPMMTYFLLAKKSHQGDVNTLTG
jgi:class 3 adenylate cyclase/HAMP domain-containing protein